MDRLARLGVQVPQVLWDQLVELVRQVSRVQLALVAQLDQEDPQGRLVPILPQDRLELQGRPDPQAQRELQDRLDLLAQRDLQAPQEPLDQPGPQGQQEL